jgi:hypothetical protein
LHRRPSCGWRRYTRACNTDRLGDGYIHVGCRCYFNENDAIQVPNAVQRSCDRSQAGLSYSWQTAARVGTGFGVRPNADAEVCASTDNYREASTLGIADVFYHARLTTKATPPNPGGGVFEPSGGIPVRFSASGEASANSAPDGFFVNLYAAAWADVSVEGFPAARFRLTLRGPGSASFDDSVTLLLTPDQLYPVSVVASVSAVIIESQGNPSSHSIEDPLWLPSHAGAQAAVDPFFQLDQGAFNAMMGEQTFSLADYYSIELSPNLAIPEPSTFALLIAVGVCAGWWRLARQGYARLSSRQGRNSGRSVGGRHQGPIKVYLSSSS